MEETTPNGEPAPQTHYDVLGVSPGATQDKVHRAYSALLAEFRENPTPEMEARVVRARIAHRVLSDPQSRAFYNADLKLPKAPQRRWEKCYLQEEEEALAFWSGIGAAGLKGLLWPYMLLKGLLWLFRAPFRAAGALLTRKRQAEEARER